MIRTKILDMAELEYIDFMTVHTMFDEHLGPNWAAVPCRRWEYVAAVVCSEILSKPGKVCDAGSGHGNAFTNFIAAKGNQVDAFDRRAHGRRDFSSGGSIKYHSLCMTNVKLPEAQYDYVFAMSSIEHVNAGKFAIPEMEFDTGDTLAMLEISKLVKPGGFLVLTTDFGPEYMPPPAIANSHRIYDWESLNSRLITPANMEYGLEVYDEIGFLGDDIFWEQINYVEPMNVPYTEMILTLKKNV
jgi:SAM-dependent methyltransferase